MQRQRRTKDWSENTNIHSLKSSSHSYYETSNPSAATSTKMPKKHTQYQQNLEPLHKRNSLNFKNGYQNTSSNIKNKSIVIDGESIDLQEIDDIEEINQSQLDKVSQVITNLMIKNKINSKNAFEVPVIDISALDSVKQNDDNAWSKIANVLENSSKVYGFRVDFMVQGINKMTNNISRSQKASQLDLTQQKQKKTAESSSSIIQPQHLEIPMLDSMENWTNKSQTLQKHLQKQKINIKLSETSNTIINNQKIRRMLDQNGLGNLMLSNLPINRSLNLAISDTIVYQNQFQNNIGQKISKQKMDFLEYAIHGKQKMQVTENIFMISQFIRNQEKPNKSCQENQQFVDCWNLDFGDIQAVRNLSTGNQEDWDLGDQDIVQIKSAEKISFTNNEEVSNGTNMLSNFLINIQPFYDPANNSNKLPKKKKQKVKLQEKQPKIKKQKAKLKIQNANIDFQNENQQFDRTTILSTSRLQSVLKEGKKPRKHKDKNIVLKYANNFPIQKQTNYAPILQNSYDLGNNNLDFQSKQLHQNPQSSTFFLPNNFSETFLNLNTENGSRLLPMPNIKQTKVWLWNQIKTSKHEKLSRLHWLYEKEKGSVSPTIIFLSVLHLGNQHNLQIFEGEEFQIEIINRNIESS